MREGADSESEVERSGQTFAPRLEVGVAQAGEPGIPGAEAKGCEIDESPQSSTRKLSPLT